MKKSSKKYKSVKMVSVDGETLSFINGARADWYVKKNLASFISEGLIKINFAPEESDRDGFNYSAVEIKNRCVVCGETDLNILTKHHVVPYVFRKRLPCEYKSRHHHDVLILCEDCHVNYEIIADKFKRDLIGEYGVISYEELTARRVHNRKVLSARHMLKNQAKIAALPYDRYQELILLSRKFVYEENEVRGAVWADEIVRVLMVRGMDEINNFMVRWRMHFIENTKPKYMPEGWSVNYKI